MVNQFLSGLRFPQLFAIIAIIFVIDLLLPDVIPLVDEILLALLTLLLSSIKKKGSKETLRLPDKKKALRLKHTTVCFDSTHSR